MGELTSAKTVPYFMILSTILSVGASIIGENFSNSPSSSLSDERRDSAYSNIVSWVRCGGRCGGHTVAFAEKCNPRGQLRPPMTITSVLLYQI